MAGLEAEWVSLCASPVFTTAYTLLPAAWKDGAKLTENLSTVSKGQCIQKDHSNFINKLDSECPLHPALLCPWPFPLMPYLFFYSNLASVFKASPYPAVLVCCLLLEENID